jgi:hypothetical protein
VYGSFRRTAACVFAILLGSYAFFWHNRDWNTASRLMLTYALGDRGTVSIDGLENQTEDKARLQGKFYSDKLPGFSLLAVLPYSAARWILRLPPHPLGRGPMPYWAADYWITLGTSGFLSACTGALLVLWSGELGCSRRQAALVGLAYGLGTPAYVYATLAFGHEASAFALFTSFYLLARPSPSRASLEVFGAGFLAAYAAVVELQVGPVAAILGAYILAQCIGRYRQPMALGLFAVGALIPTLILLAYNQLAFGSPWDMGYFHHANPEFAQVHSRANPLGLSRPDLSKLAPMLWGRYRGLAFYAPIVLLTPPGWLALCGRRASGLALVALSVVAAVLFVNLSYPEWTGGWSTGPRLLVPLLPFAMLPVAALLAGQSPIARLATWLALGLALAGAAVMLLFQGAGGRIPHTIPDPLLEAVWPLWTGDVPRPGWRFGERFTTTLVSLAAPRWTAGLSGAYGTMQFLPLVLGQAVAILSLWRAGGTQEVDGATAAQ